MVSVIIPVYNVKEFVDEAILSVINQTYRDLEIIVVDDGSTDGSGAICDSYIDKDSRIKVFHKENGGLSDARNYGLERATGEYVYFLDSDDWIVSYAIEVLVEEIQKIDGDVILFDGRCIDEYGNELTTDADSKRYYKVGTYSNGSAGKQLFAELMQQGEFRSAVPMLFIRKDTIKNRFEKILHEDELFTIQLLHEVERAGYCPNILYVRRYRMNSIMTSKKSSRNFAGLCRVFSVVASYEELDEALKAKLLDLYINALVVYQQLSGEDRKKVKADFERLELEREKCGIKGRAILYKAPPVFMDVAVKARKGIDALNYNKRRLEDVLGQVKTGTSNVFLVGTPIHGNLGDHAIAIECQSALKEAFPDSNFVEVEKTCFAQNFAQIAKKISKDDVIAINGGGWMGNQWPKNEELIRKTVTSFPNNKVIIFPQTIYYEENENSQVDMEKAREVYTHADNMLLFLRDKASFDFATSQGYKNCVYVPDMALELTYKGPELSRHGVIVVKRDDQEKVVSDEFWNDLFRYFKDKSIPFYNSRSNIWPVSAKMREKTLSRKLVEFSTAEIIVTDRLHAMVFAAVTNTPCIALDNSSKKISGVAEWMKNLPYIRIAETEQDVKDFIEEFYPASEEFMYVKPDNQEVIKRIKGWR